MRMELTMRLTMICSVCGNEHGTPDPDAFMALLSGAKAYKLCPCCGHSVDDFKDRNYRRRARRWVAKHRKEK